MKDFFTFAAQALTTFNPVMSSPHWQPTDASQFPNDHERLCALKAIGELEKALNVQPSWIRATLLPSILKEEQDALKRHIFALQAYIAPIRRLNADILGLIALEMAKVDNQAPWKMATICRSWRQAILGTPEAWCRIHVGAIEEPEELLRTALDRAGKCSLYLSIGTMKYPKQWENCRDIVREQNNRLIQVEIDTMPFGSLDANKFVTFSKLDTLSLRCTLPRDYRPSLKGKHLSALLCTGDLSATPNLHHLKLCRYDISVQIQPIFHNLTTLSLVDCILHDFHLKMECLCHSLRDLRLFDTSLVNSSPLESLNGGARPFSHHVPWEFDVLESFEFYGGGEFVVVPRIQAPRLSYLLYNHLSPPIFEDIPESLTHIHISYWRPYIQPQKDLLMQRDCFQKLTILDSWQAFVDDVLKDQSMVPSKVTAIDLVGEMAKIMEHEGFHCMLERLADRLITIRILEPNFNGYHITPIHSRGVDPV